LLRPQAAFYRDQPGWEGIGQVRGCRQDTGVGDVVVVDDVTEEQVLAALERSRS
jgi:hypothetical protein